jgi:hypothetical protein
VLAGEGHPPLWQYFSRLQERARSGGAGVMPPLWQYFLDEQKKALELMSAPKGVGPRHPRTFRLQSGTF